MQAHFYELGVEVNGSAVNLAIYQADTGEPVWSGVIGETGGSPDIQFDTNGQGGPGIIALPQGLLVLAFTPNVCDNLPGVPCPTPLASAITYAWAGSSEGVIQEGTFYYPVNTSGSDFIDTYFSLENGRFIVNTDDSGASSLSSLGEKGWTLPYDRVTLCSTVNCQGDGPSSQFFSAGVSTQSVSGQPGWRRLVPTFSFKGSVEPPSTWGGQNWAIPGLQLRFAPGKHLSIKSSLVSSGTLLTASNASAGWGGVTVSGGGSATLQGGTIVQRVMGYGNGAVTTTDGSLILDGAIVRDPVPSNLLFGVRVYGGTGGGQVVIRNGTQILGHRLGGVESTSSAWVQIKDSQIRDSGGDGLNSNGADLWVSNSDVTGHAGWGARVPGTGHVAFLDFSQTGIPAGSENTVMNGNATGDLTVSNGTITGGSAQSYRRNSFYSRTTAGPVTQLHAENGSSAALVFNYWGQAAGPDFNRVVLSGKSSFDYCPYITTWGGSTPGGPCVSDGFGGGESDALADALAALDARDPTGTVSAVRDALGATAWADSVIARSIPIVVAALRVEDTMDGRDLLTALRQAGSGFTTQDPFLARTFAQLELRKDRASGLAAVHALAADSATAPSGLAVLALDALAAGEPSAARQNAAAALAALPDVGYLAEEVTFVSMTHEAVMRTLGERTAPVVATTGFDEFAALAPVRPNPAHGRAAVDLLLETRAHVTVSVVDLLGREVTQITDARLDAGRHALTLDVTTLPAGVYLMRARAEAENRAVVLTRRLTVLR